MGNIINEIILFLLGLDSLRMIIAMLGVMKPTWKYSWLIYGRYDLNIMEAALLELGYNQNVAKEIINDFSSTAIKLQENSLVKENNACQKLIALLSKYIINFNKPINYGGTSLTTSCYYINTMEAAHNPKDLKELSDIMLYLIISQINTVDFIIVPKGGNLLFAQELAKNLRTELIVVKDEEDKSTVITSDEYYTEDIIRVNFEGSISILNKSKNSSKKLSGILVDCNTSGGSQLLSSLKKFNEVIDICNLNISKLNKAFVLFRVDEDKGDIDQKFKDLNCKLYRYFDLDESTKKQIHDAVVDSSIKKGENNSSDQNVLDYYIHTDKELINSIIATLKKNKKYYYLEEEDK